MSDDAPLPDARTWAELTALEPEFAREVLEDVVAGRRPVRELPQWAAAMDGDLAACESIVYILRARSRLLAGVVCR